jgi:hypothetical protein
MMGIYIKTVLHPEAHNEHHCNHCSEIAPEITALEFAEKL